MHDSSSDNEEPFLPRLAKDRDDEAMRERRHCHDHKSSSSRHLIVIVALISAVVSALGTIIVHNLLPIALTSSSASITFTESPRDDLLPFLDLPPLGGMLQTYIGSGVDFQSKDLNRSREAWMSLFPPGMGYISMNKVGDAGDIPKVIQDMSTDGSGRFCVAAFHQLHCLFLIYEDYRKAKSGDIAPSPEGEHSAHCFDYLRESITCAADNSLEPFRSPLDHGGTKGNGVDGFGSVHQCRDFRLLYDWSERFRYSEGHDAEKFEG